MKEDIIYKLYWILNQCKFSIAKKYYDFGILVLPTPRRAAAGESKILEKEMFFLRDTLPLLKDAVWGECTPISITELFPQLSSLILFSVHRPSLYVTYGYFVCLNQVYNSNKCFDRSFGR